MDKESLTEKLLDLVEGRETPESWRNWWDEHETELEALLSRGEFLKLKPCRHGFQWVPVFGSQKRAIAILEKSGTAFEASNLYQERYLAELDAFCKEQERVQREKQKEFKANNPELFGRYPKFSKALAKVLDPSDEIKPAATEEQIGNQESVLDFTLPSQVREFFLLTAGINVISEKRRWTPLWKSFWIQTIPGTTVPWNGFDQAEKEANTMGLDIYAGTLTRYYSHNWKTVVQQWAEENGYSFNRITPDGEPADDEELSPTDVQAAVENWRDQILAAISQPDQPPYAPWPENNEKPYYTDKPDWDAFGAMLLVAACRTYEEPVPPTVEKDWIFGEHPLIARLASDEERVWSLLRGATWWLPLTDSFLFQGPLPTDDQTMIATLGGLRKELEKLNQLAWQADEDTILGWADTEGYPVDGTVDSDGQYSKADIPEHTQYDTQSLAKFAFSMFWRAMRFAEEQQVPILLDY